MADSDLGSLRFKVEGNASGIDESRQKLTALQSAGEKTTSALSNFTKTAGAMALGMIGANGLASVLDTVKNAVTGAMNRFIEFEHSMAIVSTSVDTATFNMTELSEGVKGLAKQYGTDAGGLAGAMRNIVPEVDNAKDALRLMEVAIIGNKIGAGTLDNVFGLLDDTMDAFGLGVEESTLVLDKLHVGAVQSRISMQQISEVFANVAPLAASAGISVDQVVSSIGAMTRNGVPAGQAVNSLRVLFSELIDPASKINKALGIDGVKSAKDYENALHLLNAKSHGNIEIINQWIPGVKTLTGLTKLAGQGFIDFKDILGQTGVAAGDAKKQLDKITGTIEDIRAKTKVATDESIANLGNFAARTAALAFAGFQKLNPFASKEEVEKAAILFDQILGRIEKSAAPKTIEEMKEQIKGYDAELVKLNASAKLSATYGKEHAGDFDPEINQVKAHKEQLELLIKLQEKENKEIAGKNALLKQQRDDEAKAGEESKKIHVKTQEELDAEAKLLKEQNDLKKQFAENTKKLSLETLEIEYNTTKSILENKEDSVKKSIDLINLEYRFKIKQNDAWYDEETNKYYASGIQDTKYLYALTDKWKATIKQIKEETKGKISVALETDIKPSVTITDDMLKKVGSDISNIASSQNVENIAKLAGGTENTVKGLGMAASVFQSIVSGGIIGGAVALFTAGLNWITGAKEEDDKAKEAMIETQKAAKEMVKSTEAYVAAMNTGDINQMNTQQLEVEKTTLSGKIEERLSQQGTALADEIASARAQALIDVQSTPEYIAASKEKGRGKARHLGEIRGAAIKRAEQNVRENDPVLLALQSRLEEVNTIINTPAPMGAIDPLTQSSYAGTVTALENMKEEFNLSDDWLTLGKYWAMVKFPTQVNRDTQADLVSAYNKLTNNGGTTNLSDVISNRNSFINPTESSNISGSNSSPDITTFSPFGSSPNNDALLSSPSASLYENANIASQNASVTISVLIDPNIPLDTNTARTLGKSLGESVSVTLRAQGGL